MTNCRMGIWGWVAALISCFLLYGCDKQGGEKSGGSKDDDEKAVPTKKSGDEKPVAKTAEPAKKSGDEKPVKVRQNLFVDPSGALADVKKKIGGDKLVVLKLMIFPSFLNIEVQDQNKQENIDEFKWKDGSVKDPTPVKLTGTRDKATIDKRVFDLSEADLGAIPKMVKDAEERLSLEGGKVTHILLNRQPRFGYALQFRVYVNGTRESGSVSYDAKGAMKRVWK